MDVRKTPVLMIKTAGKFNFSLKILRATTAVKTNSLFERTAAFAAVVWETPKKNKIGPITAPVIAIDVNRIFGLTGLPRVTTAAAVVNNKVDNKSGDKSALRLFDNIGNREYETAETMAYEYFLMSSTIHLLLL